MEGGIYYVSLAVVLFIAIYFFRRGHIALSFAVVAVGAWLVYSHEEQVTYQDVKHGIYRTIDEAAKSEYEEKRLGTSIYDYNKSKVK